MFGFFEPFPTESPTHFYISDADGNFEVSESYAHEGMRDGWLKPFRAKRTFSGKYILYLRHI